MQESFNINNRGEEPGVNGIEASFARVKTTGTPFFLTVTLATKTILGSGILSLSWAFCLSTMRPGFFFTFLMCFFSAYNFGILGMCSEATGKRVYSAIWSSLFGEGSSWAPGLATATICCMSSVAYFIIIGDYLPRGLEGIGVHWELLQQRRAAILVVALLIVPLDFLKDVSFLGYTSLVGTAGAFYTVCVLMTEAAQYEDDASDWKDFSLGPGLLITIPTVTKAYNGHFNAPDLYQQMANRSPRRWVLVTIVTYSLCLVVVLVCGVTGYYMFGSELALKGRSNVLTAPQFKGKVYVMGAYIATSFSVACSVPILHRSACDSLEGLLFGTGSESPARRVVLMTLVIVSTLGTSMVVTDLGYINALAGASTATLLMFVFPSMMYLKCATDSGCVQRSLPVVSILVGAFVWVTGVGTTLLEIAGVVSLH